METLPIYISLIFALTTLLTAFLLWKATNTSRTTLILVATWLALQGIIASTGFYTLTEVTPPRLLLAVIPPFVFILILFITRRGKQFIDRMDNSISTLLHIVRIPVEIVLLLLAIHQLVPYLMTFEGRNFDILSGISAPLIWYFGFVKKKLSNRFILSWNFICLALLFNIVITAILSAPFPFQKLAFDQPNIAVLYFPFIWLPCFIVPVVLFSHMVSIRKLIQLHELKRITRISPEFKVQGHPKRR